MNQEDDSMGAMLPLIGSSVYAYDDQKTPAIPLYLRQSLLLNSSRLPAQQQQAPAWEDWRVVLTDMTGSHPLPCPNTHGGAPPSSLN